ncbi:MAG: IMP dehydrogenase [Phycisphaerales bacterium]
MPNLASQPAATTSSHPASTPRPSTGGFLPGTKIAFDGITFDDVLLLPRRSGVMPAEADTTTRLTRAISLHIPLLSAPMDTVTESALAIALAQEGGLGFIHKNLSTEAQAREVAKVKRSANGIIADPITLGPTDTVARARDLMRQYNVSGFPVTVDGSSVAGGSLRGKGKVLGIITRRDLKFVEDNATTVADVMSGPSNGKALITAAAGTTLAEAEGVLNKAKVEKLILTDGKGNLAGLITMRDIDRLSQFPRSCRDARGRLRCGAAVGVDQYDRVEALLDAEVDVIVVDTAHGHSENVLRSVRTIKALPRVARGDVQIIAGNIATPEAARDLIEAGADAIKVGIGPGSICTTRVVTGVGVPQITAVMHVAQQVKDMGVDIPVIADGGIRHSGDIPKAIAAGAHVVMLGSLFAGLEESPGEMVITHGRRYKSYRGMGSEGAMHAGSADRYGQADKAAAAKKFVPEGVEGLVPFRGTLAEFVYQLVGGLRSAMGYCGCPTIEDLRTHARFCKVSTATVVENHPHDITITKESSNYLAGRGKD